MINRRLGIVNVFVHDKGSPFRVLVLVAQPNLIDGPVLAKNSVEFFGGNFKGQVPDVKDSIDFWGEP